MRRYTVVFVAWAACATLGPADAADMVRATLKGHAILPAATFVPIPTNAPASLQVSGRWSDVSGRRLDRLYSNVITSTAADPARPMPTGFALPVVGQPVQGFSGIHPLGGDRFLVLSDNGFGGRANSGDAMLMFHEVAVDWAAGTVAVEKTTFLRDPDRVIPYRIVNETTGERYLTGADLDPESIQPVGDLVWIGEEFGPYLIAADRTGKLVRFVETAIDGKPVRSPDHYGVLVPPMPGPVAFELRRSRGYEGMAQAPDGAKLYPLLEGPLLVGEPPAPETVGGREVLRLLELDPVAGAWLPTVRRYPLDLPGNSIGDFNMVDATRALVIERDNNEGDPRRACAEKPASDCWSKPAAYKRIWLVDLAATDADGLVRKIASIDLLDVADPNGVARRGTVDGRFNFPFLTIENVHVVDPTTIVVVNDNNFPFSMGRTLGAADSTEFVLLGVGDLLQRR